MMPTKPNMFGFIAWLLSRDDVISTPSDISIARPVFNGLGELGDVQFVPVVELDVHSSWTFWSDTGKRRTHQRVIEHDDVAQELYYEYAHGICVQKELVYAPLDGRDDWEDIIERSVSAEEEDEEAASMAGV